MKKHKLMLEVVTTACLALLLGFFLAAGSLLDGGGYLGYGVEHAATNVYINWLAPDIYLSTLLYGLLVFMVLLLLWRALDWFAAQRARKLLALPTDTVFDKPVELLFDDALPGTTTDQCASKDDHLHTRHQSTVENKNLSLGTRTQSPLAKPPLCKKLKKRWFWICVLLLLCCWLPYWLGLWPGIFNYDAHYQYEMLVYAQLQTHHPLLHTVLLDGLVLLGEHYLGGVNIGVALYIGLCLFVCSLTFSGMLYTMAEEGAGKILLIGSFLFLACNPALIIWLISTNKDILFTSFLLLTTLILYRVCRFRSWELTALEDTDNQSVLPDSGKADFVLRTGPTIALALFWLVIAVLAFRTSAVYSFIVFLPFAALLIRKHLRIRLMSVMISATVVFVVAYLLITQCIFTIPSGPWQTLDALSIPRQQLARVWALTEDPQEIAAYKEIFSEEDLEYLDLYEADDADPSRIAFRESFEERPLDLLALYLAMGTTHPGAYTDAALLTSYEAWYPGAVTDGYVMESYFAKPGIARSSYIDVSPFWPASEEWVLEDFGLWLMEFGIGNVGLDITPVRLLCSPATYVWILFVVLARTICVRNRRGALVCALLLAFTLTALLSPLVVMRYYLMTMAATPLLFHIASSPSWQIKKQEDI